MNAGTHPIGEKRVALLVEHDYEDREVFGPLETLRAAGANVIIVGPTAPTEYRGTHGGLITSAVAAGRARANDFDAVIVPGGRAPDRMRMRHAMVDLVRDEAQSGKPVAAIGHGPQMLISANVLRDRMVTCWPSIAVDIKMPAACTWTNPSSRTATSSPRARPKMSPPSARRCCVPFRACKPHPADPPDAFPALGCVRLVLEIRALPRRIRPERPQ